MVVMDILEKKRQDKAKRVQKTYKITLETSEAISTEQKNCCGICGRPETDFKYGLNIDHVHFKVHAERVPLIRMWKAWTEVQGIEISRLAPNKQLAIQAVKDAALPLSVRGKLCPGRHGPVGCNRLLGRVDRIDWLERAIAYLKNPPALKVIDRLPKI